MTFSETDHPRATDGKFAEKLGSAPELSLDTDALAARYDDLTADLTEDEVTAAHAVAKAFAPNSNLAVVKVMETDVDSVGWSIGLMEENGAIHYKYIPDATGVPSRVYVAGEAARYDSPAFRAAEDAAQEALGMPAFKNERERNDRHLEIEMERAVRDGVVAPQRRMNGSEVAGDWHWGTEELRLATGPNGERISASVRIERVTKPGKDVDGNDVAVRYDFAMQGSVKDSKGREESGGQVGDYLYGADPYKKGKQTVDADLTRVAELWDKNHLNSLNAGTPSQQAWIARREEEIGRKLTTNELLDETPRDAQTDYKYGSGWLYRDVSADDIAEVLDVMRSAKSVR